MEEKIEEAMASPQNYNFLLKQDGTVVLPDDTAWKDLKELAEGNKGGHEDMDDAEQADAAELKDDDKS